MRARRGGHGPPVRLASGDRRRDLVRVATELMTKHGVDAVQIGDVAAASGISRQLVYKYFPSRQALIKAVLEDFADALTHAFGRHAMDRLPSDLEEATHVFVEAVCDTIDERGSGPWHLLDSRGPDQEVGRVGQEIMERLVAPWHARIARVTGIGVREATIVARMLVAAARAVLDLWCAGQVTRDEAVRYATRGVSALLQTFPARVEKPRARAVKAR